MTYTPTPAEFLALTEPEDDDTDAHLTTPADPLASIADSLRVLVARVEQHDADEAADDAQRERYDALDQAYADLEDKHRSLYDLLAEVEKIVAPSTSKLANSVREAITRWRNPEVPAEDEPEPGDEVPDVEPREVAAGPSQMPAHDADVETWALYAESLGFEVLGTMNRSQIRTMLGIEQPVEQ